jgi:hypothetical protein
LHIGQLQTLLGPEGPNCLNRSLSLLRLSIERLGGLTVPHLAQMRLDGILSTGDAVKLKSADK